uniref:hypothetical protein n=1 Tax=Aliarcobacter sp. TaxID=2321116 RepID=UPI004047ED61
MELKKVHIIFIIFIALFFQSCAVNKSTLKSVVQTNSATQVEEYKTEVLKSLIRYKKKLDLRNPYAYNKQIQREIISQIERKDDYINLVQNGKRLSTYKEYFYYAFSSEQINNRNDFLIIGLYKLIYKAFSMEASHQFSAVQYNEHEMLRLYEYLQVIRWKIRTAKDSNNNYLFNTWQNNWQIELAKKYNGDYNIINDLTHIKSNEESIYNPSNFSFEVVLSSMIINVEHTLRKINIEPYEMGISALKSFIFII